LTDKGLLPLIALGLLRIIVAVIVMKVWTRIAYLLMDAADEYALRRWPYSADKLTRLFFVMVSRWVVTAVWILGCLWLIVKTLR
jgi:hypothetical protein